jgi:TATA-box binding protein (TBP) (component of TFIID and TFIIIB)
MSLPDELIEKLRTVHIDQIVVSKDVGASLLKEALAGTLNGGTPVLVTRFLSPGSVLLVFAEGRPLRWQLP